MRYRLVIALRWVTGAASPSKRRDDLPILQERLGESPDLRPVRRQDRLGGVLRQVNAAHLAGAVRPAAVEAHTGEDGDAAGGDDHRNARVVAEVADQVVRASS